MMYWWERMMATDPGRKRFRQAGKASLSLMTSVFATMLILTFVGKEPLLPSILAGMVGMMGIMVVMDDTEKEKKQTTLLLPLSAASGITFGSLLAENVFLVSGLMILVTASAFYFSRYGTRYFSLGMIGFLTTYLASFLGLPVQEFLWFYMAIFIGMISAYSYNFLLFKDSARMLNHSMRSFHRQANLTFDLLEEVIRDENLLEEKKAILDQNSRKLREYASSVATDVKAQEIQELWPGLSTAQVRLYLFDAAMLVTTLSDSLQRLKEDRAFENGRIRRLLIDVLDHLRKAEVLKHSYDAYDLEKANDTLEELRGVIDDLFHSQVDRPGGWLYLLRRIEAIAGHVTEGAMEIRQSMYRDRHIEDQEEEEEAEEVEEGMKPSTKKAIQALIAGSIAIVVGHWISPIQPYWVILTTFIVQIGTDTVGRTYLKGLERSIGTVIGAIFGFGLATAVSGYAILELILIFFVIFCAFYMLSVSYTIMSVFITMLIAFMYDLILGGITYELLAARVIDTIAGAIIALTVVSFIYPTKTMNKVTTTFEEYLEELESYVTDYLKGFRGKGVKDLAENAFDLDEKLQLMEDEAKPVLQGPGIRKYSGLPRWMTIFTAINYYAKQLVASSYQKEFSYDDTVRVELERTEEKIAQNLRILRESMKEKKKAGALHDLKRERDIIETHAPASSEARGDLIHHLHYVWKINQSLLVLGARLHLDEKESRDDVL
ncbi:FUSC family protein [Salimicrobium halophilum]|uniref:Uncharacterized membrane protein YccC n=1 Tax=Salimicrobium halophilum TaxID=86666 RepID=A0A1G8RK55_9BACI|nr:FUSC family protein [Salimicrobium halophilum]SDJ17377.1 Uncharacterized membrane protein YccC [Salimicrobium halophilum]